MDSWVHSWSFGSLGSALGDVGFIRSRWVHSDAPWEMLGSSGVVGFTRERPVGRWVHAGSLGSSGVALVYALGVVRYIRCWVHPVRPECRCVHPWLLGSLKCALGVV